MDFSHDELRRQVRAAERAQAAALPAWREALGRLFSGDPLTQDAATNRAKQDLLLGGLTRRGVLRIGGTSVAAATVLAACANRSVTGVGAEQTPQAGLPTPTTGVPAWIVDDVALLRTASSLEYVAIDAYGAALDNGLLTTPALVDAASLFQEHHREHAATIERATTAAGGTPFRVRNPVVWKNLSASIQALTDEASVISFALTLENIAAATYQSTVPVFTTGALRQAAMSISAVEARHAAVLAGVMPKTARVAGIEELTAATATTAAPAEGAATDDTPTSYQVAATFASVASAIGPASYMYPWVKDDGTYDEALLPE